MVLRLKYTLFTFKNFDVKYNAGVFKSIEPSVDDFDDVATAVQDNKLNGQCQKLVFVSLKNFILLKTLFLINSSVFDASISKGK